MGYTKATRESRGQICFEAVRHHSTAAFMEFTKGFGGSAFRLFPFCYTLAFFFFFAFRHSAIRHERYPSHILSDKFLHASYSSVRYELPGCPPQGGALSSEFSDCRGRFKIDILSAYQNITSRKRESLGQTAWAILELSKLAHGNLLQPKRCTRRPAPSR